MNQYEFEEEMEFDPADYAEEIAAARRHAGLPPESPAPAVPGTQQARLQNISELIKQQPKAPAPAPAQQEQLQNTDGRYAAMLEELKGVDLFAPENDLHFLFNEMKKEQSRDLNESLLAAGLHCLAALAIKRNLVGVKFRYFKPVKINLITLLIAPSAGGKDAGHTFIKHFVDLLGMTKNIFGDVSSDKDMIKNLLFAKGKTIYLMDEAHGLFDAANDKNSNTYKKAIPNEILKMSTSSNYIVSGNHRREIESHFLSLADKAAKRIEALKDNDANFSSNAMIREKVAQDIADEEEKLTECLWAIDAVKKGVKDPFSSFYMTSTPINLDGVVTVKSLESGLMGRGLILKTPEKVARRTLKSTAAVMLERAKTSAETMQNFIDSALNSNETIPDIVDGCELDQLLVLFHDYCEEEERANNVVTGALWRRGFERVLCLASILAARTNVITRYDILYAIKVFLLHVKNCAYLAGQNAVVEKGANNSDIQAGYLAKLEEIIKESGAAGIAISKLKEKLHRTAAYKNLHAIAAKQGQDLLEVSLMMLKNVKKEGKRIFIEQ